MAHAMNIHKANELMRQVCEGFAACQLRHSVIESDKEARYELVDENGNKYTIIARAGEKVLS